MSLLESIIANSTGNRIVQRNDDPNSIDFLRGIADPGEMLSCGYLPEMRRRSGETEDQHYARIKPIFDALPEETRRKLAAALTAAALRRANLDVTNDRVIAAYAYKSAWHALGTVFSGPMTAQDIASTGYGFTVAKIPHCYRYTDRNGNEIVADHPDSYALVRTDTGAPLAAVGSRYQPLQNMDLLTALEKVISEFGAVFHAAAALDGGRRVFAAVRLKDQTIVVNGKDVTEPYLAIVNNHGYGAWSAYSTATRLECQNTVNTSLAEATKSGRVYKGRHTGDMEVKIDDMRRQFQTGIKDVQTYANHVEIMARTTITDPTKYFNNVLDAVMVETETKTLTGARILAEAMDKEAKERELKRLDNLAEKRKSILADMLERLERPANRVHGMAGTAWAAFNSVTEHANHADLGRKIGTATERTARRFDSLLSGDNNHLVQTARAQALALAQ